MVCINLSIFLISLMILATTQVRYKVGGKPNLVAESDDSYSKVMVLRGRIGSRPPRCERRCSSCAHCEAIQVPTVPQLPNGNDKHSSKLISGTGVAYERRGDGDYSSNYKPLSWKCKCGNFIFNP